MTNDRPGSGHHPAVHVAVSDRACRSRIVDALHRHGWVAVEYATGFHLLQAIAGVIDGDAGGTPGLIVVDAVSPGCAGTTIAAGLRDLGVHIPTVVIAHPGAPVIESDDNAIRVVTARTAPSAIAEIARSLSPAVILEQPASRDRAIA